MVYSQIAARPFSASIPFSATLLFEPTVTNSLVPSGLATTFLVQWWLIPAGRSTTFSGRRAVLGLARLVGHPHQGVGVGDVEVVADERHAERRGQVLEVDRLHLGDAVPVGVAQQRDPVRALHARARPIHDLAGDPGLHAGEFSVGGRRVALGHQHVAVRQGVEPARVVEPLGEGRDRQAGGGRGLGALRPARGRRDVDGGQRRRVRGGQRRVRPLAVGELERRALGIDREAHEGRTAEEKDRQRPEPDLRTCPHGPVNPVRRPPPARPTGLTGR